MLDDHEDETHEFWIITADGDPLMLTTADDGKLET